MNILFKFFFVFTIVLSANAEEKKCDFKISGRHDLSLPSPSIIAERNTQLQQIVASYIPQFRYCLERAMAEFGDKHTMADLNLKFDVLADGTVKTIPVKKNAFQRLGKAEAYNKSLAECYLNSIRKIKISKSTCPQSIPYKWKGHFPLLNTRRITYPEPKTGVR